MSENSEIRLDAYLWAIRIYKSRTLAGNAIKSGRIKLNGKAVKPSHIVKIAEVYKIKISAQSEKTIEVTGLIDKRSSHENAMKNYIDRTPVDEKITKESKVFFTMNVKHEKGSGRPTKRDRRNLRKDGGWF